MSPLLDAEIKHTASENQSNNDVTIWNVQRLATGKCGRRTPTPAPRLQYGPTNLYAQEISTISFVNFQGSFSMKRKF